MDATFQRNASDSMGLFPKRSDRETLYGWESGSVRWIAFLWNGIDKRASTLYLTSHDESEARINKARMIRV